MEVQPAHAAGPLVQDELRLGMAPLLDSRAGTAGALALSDPEFGKAILRMTSSLWAMQTESMEGNGQKWQPADGGPWMGTDAAHLKAAATRDAPLSKARSGGAVDDGPVRLAQARVEPSAETQSGATPGRPPREPAGDDSLKWGLAPIRFRWNGSTATAITVQRTSDGQDSTQNVNVLNLTGYANSYLWQPWFAQVNGNLGMNLIQTGSNGIRTNAVALTGTGRLTVLPRTRFPFEAFFDASDSRTTGDALGSASRRVRFGARQNYQPTTHVGTYSAGYERTMQSSFGLGDETTDILDFRAVRGIGDNQSVNADGSLVLSDRGNDRLQLMNLRGNHYWRPEDNLSLQSDASFVSSKVDSAAAGGFSAQFMQLGGVATWNSEEIPLYVTGGVRFSGSLTESDGVSSNTGAFNANVGATYEYSRNIRLTGSAALNKTDASMMTSQAAGVAYTSDNETVFNNFTYQKAASANISNQTGDNGGRTASEAASHSLTKALPGIYGGNLFMNFNQGLFLTQASGTVSNPNRLAHGANLQWGRFWEAAYVSAGLTASDSRALGGETDALQSVNLNINANRGLSTTANLSGALSVQLSRHETENQNSSGQGTVSTNFTASYQNTRMFGIPRLEFNSLLLGTFSQLPSNSGVATASQAEVRWDNRFKYFLGKTEFQLRGEVAQTGAHRRFLLFLYVNRALN